MLNRKNYLEADSRVLKIKDYKKEKHASKRHYLNETKLSVWIHDAGISRQELASYIKCSMPWLHHRMSNPAKYLTISQAQMLAYMINKPLKDVVYVILEKRSPDDSNWFEDNS